MKKKQNIYTFKDGQFIPWKGEDVDSLLIEERMTLSEIKKQYPDKYETLKKWLAEQKK